MLVNELLKLDASNKTTAIITLDKNDGDYFKCNNYDDVNNIPDKLLKKDISQFDYDYDGTSLLLTIIVYK